MAITYNTNYMAYQLFSLPPRMMDYMFKKIQAKLVLKLYQCSKFFYNLIRHNIIFNLEIVGDNEPEFFNSTKTVLRLSNPVISKLKDFWFIDSLTCRVPIKSNVLFRDFSHLLFKKMELFEEISYTTYRDLTRAQSVKDLKIKGILGDNGDLLPIQYIIFRVPKATSIEIFESYVNPATNNSWPVCQPKAKFSNFVLHNISNQQNLDLIYLSEFLGNNSKDNCHVHLDFKMLPKNSCSFKKYNDDLQKLEKIYNNFAVATVDDDLLFELQSVLRL